MAMAMEPKVDSEKKTSITGNYKVDLMTILGQGAYGVVHPAYDSTGNKWQPKE